MSAYHALKLAQAAKSAIELQQYREGLRIEASDRAHAPLAQSQSVLSAKYVATATTCVCILLVGWLQGERPMPMSAALAFLFNQRGQDSRPLARPTEAALTSFLKADLAQALQADCTMRSGEQDTVHNTDYTIDIKVRAVSHPDPAKGKQPSQLHAAQRPQQPRQTPAYDSKGHARYSTDTLRLSVTCRCR